MNHTNEDPKESKNDVSTEAEKLRSQTEDRLLRAYVSSLLTTSPAIDKFNTWLLAVVGGAATLVITNIGSISRIIATDRIRLSLLLLVVSGLFGVLEKYVANRIRVNLAQEEKLRRILKPLSADYKDRKCNIEIRAILNGKEIKADIDTRKVLNEYADLHCWLFRKSLTGSPSLRLTLRRNVCFYHTQIVYGGLQITFFLAFVCLLAFSI